MSTCPHHKLRADLPPLTERLKKLPVDERGYPIPFFVGWIKGKPEFRVADPLKVIMCHTQKLCWVCGQRLRSDEMAFPIGPMCCINRISAEPPSHIDCAEWSVKGCPFLAKPQMVRREDDFTRAMDKGPGIMLDRNPGVIAVWVTRSYTTQRDPLENRARRLFVVGEPLSVGFWRLGRPATRAEVIESIESGLPLLLNTARTPRERAAAEQQINVRYEEVKALLPKE